MSTLKSDARDVNFFFESQLNTFANTWDLIAVKSDNEKIKILSGIMSDTSLTITGRNNFASDTSSELFNTIKGGVHWAQNHFNNISEFGSLAKGSINELFESGVDGAIEVALDEIGNTLANGDENKKATIKNSKLMGIINKGKEAVGGKMVNAFDYIQIFKNTELGFSIPSLNTRVIYGVPYISDYQLDGVTIDGMKLKPNEIVKNLLNYFIGGDMATGVDLVDRFISIQKSPLGYAPIFNLVREYKELVGTFTLRYGNYKIPNLLVTGFNYNVSNIRVREGRRSNDNSVKGKTFHEGYTKMVNAPLYADISIDLMPSTYISKELIDSLLDSQFDISES